MKKFISSTSNYLKAANCKALISIFLLFFLNNMSAQSSGIYESYAILSINGGANVYYDMQATTANPDLQGSNLGSFTLGTHSLIIKGGQNKTFKNGGCNINSSTIYYRIYRTGITPGSFVSINETWTADNGGGNQTWERTNGSTNLINGIVPGNYTLEIYSSAGYDSCGSGTHYSSNSGANYKASFTVLYDPLFPVSITSTTGSGAVGFTYATLKAGIDAINSGIHTGIVTMQIGGDTTETTTSVLNASGSGSASYTAISIQPTGGIARTITGNIPAGFSVLNLNGADNVTIDGLNTSGNSLTISNTTIAATSGTSTIQFIGDATNNIVQNCTIKGSGTATDSGTILFSSGTTIGNNNNTITNNTITSAGNNLPTNGIYSSGSVGIGNNTNIISNNNIQDYFKATANANGIYLAANSASWTITGNKLFQSAARNISVDLVNHRGVFINTGEGGYVISNNTIGFANASGTGFTSYSNTAASSFTGIEVNASGILSIQSNTIAGINMYAPGNYSVIITGNFYITAIKTAGTASFTIDDNTIGSASTAHSITVQFNGAITGIPSYFYGIYNTATGNNITITNNRILNCTSAGSYASRFYGIYNLNGSDAVNISSNTIDRAELSGTGSFELIRNDAAANTLSINSNIFRNNVAAYSASSSFTPLFYGIANRGAVSSSININSNKLGDISGGLISYNTIVMEGFYGIYNTAGAATASLTIQYNDFRGISTNNGSGNTYDKYFIYNEAATLSQNISYNTFTNINIPFSLNLYIISNNVSLPASGFQTVTENSIVGTFTASSIWGSAKLWLYYTAANSAATATIFNTNNNFSNITTTAYYPGAIMGWVNQDTGLANKSISTNVFSNWTGGAGDVTAMNLDGFGSGSSVTGNTISNISSDQNITGIKLGGNSSAGTTINSNDISGLVSSVNYTNSLVVGIQDIGTNNASYKSIDGNTIHTLSVEGTSAGVYGIKKDFDGGTAAIVSNTIYNLSGTGTGSPTACGISCRNSGLNANIYKNKIYNIAENGVSTGAKVYGFQVLGTFPPLVYNNIIGDLRAPNTSNDIAIVGIESHVTPSADREFDMFSNTIYLNASSTGTNFGTAAIYQYASGSPNMNDLKINNNIFINKSTAKGTGKTVVFQGSGYSVSGYNSTSNRNLLYAGTSSASNLIYKDLSNNLETLTALQSYLSPRESSSKTGDPIFLSTTGADANYLHIDPTDNTGIESGGQGSLTNNTTDFDGDSRNLTTPDIGADEGTFGLPAITSFSSPSRCVGTYITIYGRNLNNVTSVTIGGTAATNVSVGTLNGVTYVSALIGTGTTGTVTVNTSTGYSATSTEIFTVDQPTVAGTISFAGGSTTQTMCVGATASDISLVGETGTVKWWNLKRDNSLYVYQIITTSTTFSDALFPGYLNISDDNFTVWATVQSGACNTVNTNTVHVIVTPYIAETISPSVQNICVGGTNYSLTVSNNQTAVFQRSDDYAFTNPVDINNPTLYPFQLYGDVIGNLYVTTYFRAKFIAAGGCVSYSPVVTVNVDVAPVGGNLTGDTSVCYGATSGLITLTGQSGTIQNWESSVSPFQFWNTIANTTNTYNSGPLTETTQFRALVGNGSCVSAVSSTTTVTVGANNGGPITAVGGTVSGDQSVNTGTQPDTNLTAAPTIGTVAYWEMASDSGFSSPTTINVVSNTLTGAQIGILNATTYFRAVVQDGCTFANSTNYVTITVSSGFTMSPNQVICFNTQPTDLSTTNYSGSITGWQSSSDALFTSPTDINVTAATLSGATIGNLSATTYFRVVTNNGAINYSPAITISITAAPTAAMLGSNSPVNAGSTILLTATVGNAVSYSWVGPNGFSSINQNPSITNCTPLAGGTYTATVTDNITGCQNSATINITVNALEYTQIPDTNFEQRLIDLGNDNIIDGQVLTTNISGITFLDVASLNIASLTGIQDFTALQTLYCQSNSLSTLNLTSNPNLNWLSCSSNNLSSLNVTGLTNLTFLDCSQNILPSLNFSSNSNLITAYCGSNSLLYINVNGLTNLQQIECNNNSLSTLDLTSNLGLTSINCDYNNLITLNLNPSAPISTLSCQFNQLTSIDVSLYSNMMGLYCASNQFSYLDISNNSSLAYFYAYSNPSLICIKVADAVTAAANMNWIVDNTALYSSSPSNTVDAGTVSGDQSINAGTQADIIYAYPNVGNVIYWQKSTDATFTNPITIASANSFLYGYEMLPLAVTSYFRAVVQDGCSTAYSTNYVTVTVTGIAGPYTAIPDAHFEATLIQQGYDDIFDGQVLTSSISGLMYLDVSNKNIADLTGIQDFAALQTLYCYSNNLTSLDLTSNSNLTYIDCNSNANLASLNVTGLTNLTGIDCYSGSLTSLDISTNTNLGYLDCDTNHLTNLNLNGASSLGTLYCYSNNLTSLNTCSNTNLSGFDASSNAITTFDIRNNPTFSWMYMNNQTPSGAKIYVNDVNNTNGSWFIDGDATYIDGTVGGTASTDQVIAFGSQPASLNLTGNVGKIVKWQSASDTAFTTNVVDIANITTTLSGAEMGVLNTTTYYRAVLGGGTCTPILSYTSSVATITVAPITLIPDSNFEQALINLGHDDIIDGYVLTANISGLTSLDISNNNITDLTGIQDFVALTNLNCWSNNLTTLNLTSNTQLNYIDCDNNFNLANINLTGLVNLTGIDCYSTGLSSLDLTTSVNLNYVDCDNSQLTVLNLNPNSPITGLYCNNNQLTHIDVSTYPNMTTFYCYSNALTYLDISNNNSLTWFDATNNPSLSCIIVADPVVATNNGNWFVDNFTLYSSSPTNTADAGTVSGDQTITSGTAPTTDLTANPNIGTVVYWQKSIDATFTAPINITNATNTLSIAEIGNLTATTYFRTVVQDGCSLANATNYATITVTGDGGLIYTLIPDLNFEQYLINQGIDANPVPDGRVLTSAISSLTSLDVSSQNIANLTGIQDFVSLTSLDCRFNIISSLNISTLTNLTDLHCGYSTLSGGLDISQNMALTTLECVYAGLTTIDVANHTNLTSLTLQGNSLTSIDLAANTNLSYLDVTSNLLPYLNVSTNLSLTTLNASSNQLTAIDVTVNTALTTLSVSTNPISTLNVSSNINLQFLNVQSTNLTTLDLATNTQLTRLEGGHCHFTTLDLTHNPLMQRVWVNDNQLTSIIGTETMTQLSEIGFYNNLLTTVNVCSSTNIFYLQIFGNNLTTVDVSNSSVYYLNTLPGNPSLTTIYVNNVAVANAQPTNLWIKDAAVNYALGGNAVGGTLDNATVCVGTNSSTLTLSDYTGKIVKWQSSTTADFSANVTDIANSFETLTVTNLDVTTYYRAVLFNGTCSADAYSTIGLINVIAASIGGTTSGNATICAGTQASDIVLSGNTGSVVKWQSATTADFSGTVTDITSASTTLLGSVIGNVSDTTYYRAVVQNGSCTVANSSTATMSIPNTTWDGNAWSNGEPNALTSTVITGNYSSTGNLYMCNLTVNNGAVVVINPGDNFVVTRKVTVVTGSSLTVESNANLVQIDNIADEGNIIVKRDTNPLKRLDYNLWSTPVTGQNLFNFSPLTSVSSTVSRFYSYNPTTDQYSYIFNPENYTFNPGEGYLIRVPNTWSDTTPAIFHGQFGGVPNNGDYNFSVVSNAYNAIGNPYPSTINADLFIDTNNIQGAIYFWRKTNNTNTSSYATYTKAGGTRNTEYTLLEPGNIFNANGLTPNGTIQVGQGFITRTSASTLHFNNAMRVTNNANQFLRTGIEKNRIWLNVISNTNSNQLLISYMTGATNGVDAAIDGKYVNDCQTALTTYLDNSEYIIQGRALPFVDTDVVPLTFKTTTAGNYEVSIDHVDGLFLGNQNIYIKDNFTGEVHDLKQSAYTYASNVGVFNNRFEIVYTSSPLSTQNPVFNENSIIIYKQNEVLNINSGNVSMQTVKIYDVRGRLVYQQKDTNTTTLAIKDLNAAQQVLIVQVTSADNKIVSKKIVY